jgi:hypothetical protein
VLTISQIPSNSLHGLATLSSSTYHTTRHILRNAQTDAHPANHQYPPTHTCLPGNNSRIGTPELMTSPTALTAFSTLGKPEMATVVGNSGASRMVAVGFQEISAFVSMTQKAVYWRTFGDDPKCPFGTDKQFRQIESSRRFPGGRT